MGGKLFSGTSDRLKAATRAVWKEHSFLMATRGILLSTAGSDDQFVLKGGRMLVYPCEQWCSTFTVISMGKILIFIAEFLAAMSLSFIKTHQHLDLQIALPHSSFCTGLKDMLLRPLTCLYLITAYN